MEITSRSETPQLINGSSIRSDPNSPYPTTFVTADTSSFKQVVQLLTGSSDPSPNLPPPTPSSSRSFVIPAVKTAPGKKHQHQHQQGFKLYDRRMKNNHHLPNLQDSTFLNNVNPPEMLSPSVLDFPSLTLSPVTPLSPPPSSEEERAIACKGFYLHPSPMSTPRDSEPQLLPLFPLTSPRVSDPSSSTG